MLEPDLNQLEIHSAHHSITATLPTKLNLLYFILFDLIKFQKKFDSKKHMKQFSNQKMDTGFGFPDPESTGLPIFRAIGRL